MQVHSPLRKLLFTAALALLLPLFSTESRAQDDPPMQAGRISNLSGNVSVQPVGLDDWGQAQVNLPFGPGDRLFTDSDGQAEIQIGQIYVRIGPNSDVSMIGETPDSVSIGLGQGSVRVHCRGLWPGQSFHLSTPNGAATLDSASELRVDVMPDQDAAVFTSLGAHAIIGGANYFEQDIVQGQALELAGTNPVMPEYLAPAPFDGLDAWSQQRDRQIAMAASWQYISPDIPGGEDLDAAGSWMPGTPYGAIWFPNVPQGWAPYHYGRWVNRAPWGPVWVEDEPWGYAPFHYGRWIVFQGRWGWVPGPRQAHPVWSPALVVFAGGVQVGGAAMSVWFPLGPGEPYRPWYPCSPRYVDQVNISNMAEGPRVHVLTTYVGFNFGGINFALRTVGVTAIRQEDFAAGRPVRQANVVVNVNVIQHVTIIERPVVQINERVALNSHPPSRPVRVAAARPTLISEKGMVVSARPGFHPVAAPVKPAPVVRPLPGRQGVAPPPGSHVPPPAHPVPAAHTAAPPPPLAAHPTPAAAPAHPTPAARPAINATEPGARPAGNPPPAANTPHPQIKEEQPTPKPPAQNSVAPEKTTPQPGAKPGETPTTRQGEKSGNGHNGKPEDKDKKDDHKNDKQPENK